MNVKFLKLLVADDPWILVDGSALSGDEPEWGEVAVGICHRARGAAASGLLVMGGAGGATSAEGAVRAWSRTGAVTPLRPAAALCAARWLFDTGRADAESVILRSPDGSGATEVMVIDSRNFGLAVGEAATEDGRPISGDGLPVSRATGSAIVARVSLAGQIMAVTLYDEKPESGRGRSEGKGVEALCVARHELFVRRRSFDPLVAAAGALAAAAAVGYADTEAAVRVGGDRVMVQWPAGGPLFAAAAVSYSLTGEFWMSDE